MTGRITFIWIAIATLGLVLSAAPSSAAAMPTPLPGSDTVPVLAYYYIWYTPGSWDRAKIDLPLLGTYSSDDATVMRQHVKWAKAAGIDGFIVAWKNTETLTPRLLQLVEISREESFKLVVNYESLDFYRNPLPIDQVTADFQYFETMAASDPVFDLFGKPVMIWSGTWKFDRVQIEQATAPVRDSLFVLASEKQSEHYENIFDLVDGNAYYWSSVDPLSHENYANKLLQMEERVHAHGGLWIAPAAPGFDARLLGGKRVIDRSGGLIMEVELATAFDSMPDAVGIISWNEFSENTHIEPSCLYGVESLSTVAALLGGDAPTVTDQCDAAALASARANSSATPEPSPATARNGDEMVALTAVDPAIGAVDDTFDSLWPVDNSPRNASIKVDDDDAPFDWDSSAPQGNVSATSRFKATFYLLPIGLLLLGSVVIVSLRAFHFQPDDNDAGTRRPSADDNTPERSGDKR